MKKITLLELAAALLTTNLVYGATVFSSDDASLSIIGRGKINFNNNDADSKHRLSSTARLGVEGKTNVNDHLGLFSTVIYDLEAQDADVDKRLRIREAFIGFDFKDFGKLSFGRYRDGFYKTTSVTDLFIDYGKTAVSYWGLSSNDYGGRKDGQAKYDLKYNGFILSASYQFKQSNKFINYGVGGTIGYEFELPNSSPLGILAGYNHYDGLKSDSSSGWSSSGLYYGADKNEAAVSLYYGTFAQPGLYLAAVYNHGKLENTYESNAIEAAISYTTPQKDWTFTAVYQYNHNADRDLTRKAFNRDNATLSGAWTAEIVYNLTPKFQIYTDLERRPESVIKKESDTRATLGFIYNF